MVSPHYCAITFSEMSFSKHYQLSTFSLVGGGTSNNVRLSQIQMHPEDEEKKSISCSVVRHFKRPSAKAS